MADMAMLAAMLGMFKHQVSLFPNAVFEIEDGEPVLVVLGALWCWRKVVPMLTTEASVTSRRPVREPWPDRCPRQARFATRHPRFASGTRPAPSNRDPR